MDRTDERVKVRQKQKGRKGGKQDERETKFEWTKKLKVHLKLEQFLYSSEDCTQISSVR
jgi:hypothetical protein